MQIIVDEDLKTLIPQLEIEEYTILERSILDEGCRDDLIVWTDKNILVDGHNRYGICQKHGLEFGVTFRDFASHAEVEIWMIANQKGRRNLSKGWDTYLLGKRYEAEKKPQGGQDGNTNAKNEGIIMIPSLTAQTIANELGVAAPTVKRAAQYTQAVDTLVENIGPEAKQAILGKHSKASQKDVKEIAKAPKEQQEVFLNKVLEGSSLFRAKLDLEKTLRPKPKKSQIKTSKQPKLIIGKAESLTDYIAKDSIDIIITSPPYNLGDEQMPMGGGGRTPRDNGIGYDDNIAQSRYEDWQASCLNQMYQVSKEGGSLFYNHKVRTKNGAVIHPLLWLIRSDWTIRQEIIWNRKSTHNMTPSLFWNIDERIFWLTKGKPTIHTRSIGQSTIWEEFGPKAHTWHPAPFTEELPRFLLKSIAQDAKDLTILDPFAGSCTTVKVALEMGFDAIGVDISKDYLDRAKEYNGWGHA